MDAYIQATNITSPSPDPATEIAHWLQVSGDLDDFIYYDEEPYSSQR